MALESSVVWPTYGNGYKLSQSVTVFFQIIKFVRLLNSSGQTKIDTTLGWLSLLTSNFEL